MSGTAIRERHAVHFGKSLANNSEISFNHVDRYVHANQSLYRFELIMQQIRVQRNASALRLFRVETTLN